MLFLPVRPIFSLFKTPKFVSLGWFSDFWWNFKYRRGGDFVTIITTISRILGYLWYTEKSIKNRKIVLETQIRAFCIEKIWASMFKTIFPSQPIWAVSKLTRPIFRTFCFKNFRDQFIFVKILIRRMVGQGLQTYIIFS